MSDIIIPRKDYFLNVGEKEDEELIACIGHALSVPDRIAILRSILLAPKNLSDISEELNIPISSVSRHIDALAAAGLIFVTYQPGRKGHTKFCSQAIVACTIGFSPVTDPDADRKEYAVEMPIGLFTACDISAPCGMLSREAPIGRFDDPDIFFSPARSGAECLWFESGFIGYDFPSDVLRHRKCRELVFSFEICSETFYYNNNWKSDITVTVNGIELVTFTSPGDFGGRRGKYTPEYWAITSTQFGLLKKIAINEQGVFVDYILIHDRVKIGDLKLQKGKSVQLKIGVKEDAEHRGGINLFGRNFGDYPQAIVMTVR